MEDNRPHLVVSGWQTLSVLINLGISTTHIYGGDPTAWPCGADPAADQTEVTGSPAVLSSPQSSVISEDELR